MQAKTEVTRGVRRYEVGRNLYFFENPAGENRCLISTHGVYGPTTGKFNVSSISPDIRLLFYGPEDQMIQDPGINLMSRGARIIDEYPSQAGGSIVRNYWLTKYQGNNEGDETYNSIRNQIIKDETYSSNYRAERAQGRTTQVMDDLFNAMTFAHIVTVRKRGGVHAFSGIGLKDLLEAVRRFRSDVTEFHCVFCRLRATAYVKDKFRGRKTTAATVQMGPRVGV